MRLHEIDIPKRSFRETIIGWFMTTRIHSDHEKAMLKLHDMTKYQYEPMTCYRGIPLEYKPFETILELLNTGKITIHSERRVTSWSKDYNIAGRFAGNEGNYGILIQKVLQPDDIILDTTNEHAMNEVDHIIFPLGSTSMESIVPVSEKEVVAIRRPMENIELCQDVIGFRALIRNPYLRSSDTDKANLEIFKKALEPHMNPEEFARWSPNIDFWFKCDEQGRITSK